MKKKKKTDLRNTFFSTGDIQGKKAYIIMPFKDRCRAGRGSSHFKDQIDKIPANCCFQTHLNTGTKSKN